MIQPATQNGESASPVLLEAAVQGEFPNSHLDLLHFLYFFSVSHTSPNLSTLTVNFSCFPGLSIFMTQSAGVTRLDEDAGKMEKDTHLVPSCHSDSKTA